MVVNRLEDVREFLGLQRIALVGVSRDAKDFSRSLFREFRERGYDVIPVNPAAEEIEGARCYARVSDVAPRADGALVLTKAAQAAAVVRDCAAAGIRRVWLFQGGPGSGAVSEEAVAACREAAMTVIAGECPFMFLEGGSWIHRAHGWLRRIAAKYPN
jgi:predicted CoA-binding protein